jgi:hypothetical protein
VTAAAVWLIRGRAIFAVSGIWSAIALGTGAWIALTTTPRLSSVAVGPLALPIELVGAVLVVAAPLCLIGSVIGWLASPAEAPATPHMPPPRTKLDHRPPLGRLPSGRFLVRPDR